MRTSKLILVSKNSGHSWLWGLVSNFTLEHFLSFSNCPLHPQEKLFCSSFKNIDCFGKIKSIPGSLVFAKASLGDDKWMDGTLYLMKNVSPILQNSYGMHKKNGGHYLFILFIAAEDHKKLTDPSCLHFKIFDCFWHICFLLLQPIRNPKSKFVSALKMYLWGLKNLVVLQKSNKFK